jgi:methylated-DNA-protein-cysteine methyltransferase-like protein
MKESFFDKVYEVVKQIPYGRVTTYGIIAEYLGSKGSARMVGWALNSKKNNLKNIPAHRVVNRNGMLTGKRHFGGNDIMKTLLENEGIEVDNDKIVNFEKIIWRPGNK